MTDKERAAGGLREAYPAYDTGWADGAWYAFPVSAPHPALALISADSPDELAAKIEAMEIARCGGRAHWWHWRGKAPRRA